MPTDDAPTGPRWLKYDWSVWHSLDTATKTRGFIPGAQGIYRVRMPSADVLLYVGISVKLSKRLRGLRRARDSDDHRGHYAGGGIAAHQGDGPSIEVSWVVMSDIDRRELMGREADLICSHRRVTGDSPACQFHGMPLPDADGSEPLG